MLLLSAYQTEQYGQERMSKRKIALSKQEIINVKKKKKSAYFSQYIKFLIKTF
jgi:hypothetical protein